MASIIIIAFIAIGVLLMTIGNKDKAAPHEIMDAEYLLEIVDDDSVIILNTESGRIYTVHMDSIKSTLLLDNL